ncbi:MAG: nitrite reductase small subunit NirD [Hyphomonas sp.]|uniref:nitrite reductase small subunit NirD n=1 Tax=Hyphomonas sp. TaxID=87 RepID=UPI0030016967
MEKWVDVCTLDEIPLRGARRVKIFGEEVAIFRTGKDAVFALDNRCPHKGGPLSEGIVHDDGVTCPLHGLIMHLPTGAALGGDAGCVKTYAVRVDDRQVSLRIGG